MSKPVLIVSDCNSELFERLKHQLGEMFEVVDSLLAFKLPELPKLPEFELPEWFVLQLGKPIEMLEFVELLERKWPCIVELPLESQTEGPIFTRFRLNRREHQRSECG